jgi:hypothetical protein
MHQCARIHRYIPTVLGCTDFRIPQLLLSQTEVISAVEAVHEAKLKVVLETTLILVKKVGLVSPKLLV